MVCGILLTVQQRYYIISCMKHKKSSLTSADIAAVALFTALMIAGAYISIPFPLVPLTFQTAFAVLAGLVLGSRRGMFATAAYMVLGLIGIPVFNSGGGFQYVAKPSFGFIVGFIAAAGVAGLAYGRAEPKLSMHILISLMAVLANYIVGGAYVYVWLLINSPSDIAAQMAAMVLAFIPKDCALGIFAALLARRILRITGRDRAEKLKSASAVLHSETSANADSVAVIDGQCMPFTRTANTNSSCSDGGGESHQG